MNVSSNLHGIIRGKIIELADDPGLNEGQEVEVILRPTNPGAARGDGLRRSGGALADSWGPEDDKILEEIHEARTRSVGREIPE